MTDILLINPSSTTVQNNPIPFGLAYIAGFLEKNNFSVRILDLSIKSMTDEEILSNIEKTNPKKIGFSCMSVHVSFIKRITKKIKEKFDRIILIAGGTHITALPNESINELENVDLFVLGEGEKTILEIMKNIKLSKINGIAYIENKKVQINPPREFIKDLDGLPFPARHLLANINKYQLGFDWEGRKPSATIFSSRGCPFNCIYCASKIMWKQRVRFRSAENILEEIDFLVKKYRVKEILFYDDHFVLDKERLVKICKGLIKRNYNLTWCCLSRVDCMTLKIAKLMKKSGCHMISFGVESGSQTILNVMKKNVKIKDIVKTFEICKKAGMHTKASFIFGAPKETEETINETQKLLKIIRPDYIWLFIMTPLPGTELYKMHEKAGIISKDWAMYDQTTYNKFYDTNLTYEELRTAVAKTYKSYYFSFGYAFSQIKKFNLPKFFAYFRLFKLLPYALKYIKKGRLKNEGD